MKPTIVDKNGTPLQEGDTIYRPDKPTWEDWIIIKIKDTKVLDVKGSTSGSIGLVNYPEEDETERYWVKRAATGATTTSNSLYCSCTSPQLVTNQVMGETFQVCQTCKKERRN